MKFSDILSMFQQGKGTARSHMKNLIEMAAADGNFQDLEYDLLKTIAKKEMAFRKSVERDIRQNHAGIQFELPTDPKENSINCMTWFI